MKTIVKAFALVSLFFCSASISAKDINSNDVESSYIKCEMNESGKLTPNYFVVVEGISYQTDSKTFHLIQKSKNMDMKLALSIDQNQMMVSVEKSALAEK